MPVDGGATALLFPGQGSQYVGMGRALAEASPAALEILERVDDALGEPLSRLCFEGDEEELRLTENTQPAILAVGAAVHAELRRRGLRASWLAGHSLGQYTALVAASSLELEEAARLVRRRGRYMQEAVPPGRGAMAAVLGLDARTVEEVCAAHDGEGTVEPANYNAPGQVVIAGHREAVEAAIEGAREAGARRAILLDVSAPFHCSLMAPAAKRLEADLESTSFRDPALPVIDNVSARPLRDAREARDALVRQVTAPVRWLESVRWIRDQGARTFVEAGPGRVLSGLVRRSVDDASVHSVESPEEIEALIDGLGAEPGGMG